MSLYKFKSSRCSPCNQSNQRRRKVYRCWVSSSPIIVFFPPVWPIRTRHGPYNSVSGEKHNCIGHVWSKYSGKSSTKTKQTKQNHDQERPANPPARFAFRHKTKQRSNKKTGPGPTKTKQNTTLDLPWIQ